MNITHHLDDVTLMGFSAGTLGEALSAVVACHIHWCPSCRAKARQMRLIGAVLLEDLDPQPLTKRSGGQLDARMSDVINVREFPVRPRSVSTEVTALPQPLIRSLNADLPGLSWKWLAPGVKHVPVPLSDRATGDLRLLDIAPGRKMPEHGHSGSELTLVLRGSYTDEVGQFKRGDVADVDEHVEHQPVVDLGEHCVCLVASEGPAHFKTLTGKIIQRFVGM